MSKVASFPHSSVFFAFFGKLKPDSKIAPTVFWNRPSSLARQENRPSAQAQEVYAKNRFSLKNHDEDRGAVVFTNCDSKTYQVEICG